MKRIILAMALAAPFVAAASDDLNCSTKAKKLNSKAELTAMAKVSDADARKAAIDKIGAAGAMIIKGGIESEDGCLIYSFDVKTPGKKGIDEVIVDAGNGTILKVDHESKVREKVVSAKNKVVEESKELKDKVTGRTPGTDK